MNLNEIKEYLAHYDGPEMRIMEVCGSHTAAIAKNGIPSLLSEKIRLLSGPGCPVCVTPSAYIDRLIELAKTPGKCVVTFGDLLRVPGSRSSLSAEKGDGASVRMVYSPMDTLKLAEDDPDTEYIFAAVGFETTMPVYALLMDALVRKKIKNVKLLTALKTMPPVIDSLCSRGARIDGFIAPGHVSVVTGFGVFAPLARKYSIPFGVAGFTGPELLVAVCGIVKKRGMGEVVNFYPSVVTREGNTRAKQLIQTFFEPCDAVWRGLGNIPCSGMALRPEYASFDAGSRELQEDHLINRACRCGEVLMGKIQPNECPLHGRACTPLTPQGACMVSPEGSCNSWFVNHRTR